jgi:outer membrane protein OmpA-like peptidoglycan-associated protein
VSYVGDVMIPLTLHQASFTQMPGVPNCCTEFRFGMGTGFSLAGGVQRKELTRFLGMDVVSGAKLRVSYEQTTMSEQNAIGNVIIGSQVIPGISEHTLRSTMLDVAVEPTLVLPSVQGSAWSVVGALRLGASVLARYEQYEQLVNAPASVSFENGSTRRNAQSGTIPEASTFRAALVLGARYGSTEWNSMMIEPQLLVALSLTPVIPGYTWYTHSVSAGVHVRLLPSPPPPPPSPPPPPPPAVIVPEKRLIAGVQLLLRGQPQPLVRDTTINVTVPIIVDERRESLAPYVFFAKNSVQMTAQDTLLAQESARLMNMQPSLRVKLYSKQSSDEDTSMARKRGDAMKKLIQEFGIDDWKIAIETERGRNERYDELEEESRRIFVSLSNKQLPMLITRDTTRLDVPPVECHALTTVTADTTAEATLTVSDAVGRTMQTLSDGLVGTERRTAIQISSEWLMSGKAQSVQATLRATDADGRNASGTTPRSTWVPQLELRETRVKHVQSGTASDAMVLGFFAFDESEFSCIDMNVVDQVRRHRAAGGRVSIIAMTDSLGDNDENTKLATERAQTAAKLLGVTDADVQIRTGGMQLNTTPEGRSRNRSVLVICR